ncbi:MraY family glycosyltransferase [Massilia horti]|uniref:Glycosyl transferase 4 family protein n=1 Tax=Massilia horti TaxID=2562153 RepID=A0A4Y9T016_9BURK|nr:glycosyltransferase [Massilia horti]TFW32059.1 glycosyl transferase 4 family protein [Massilia horti]
MLTHLLIAAMVAAGTSAIASLVIIISQRWHGKLSLDHDLEGVQKFHARAVPRIGGIAIITAISLTLLFSYCFTGDLLSVSAFSAAVLLLCAGLPAFVAGVTEDLTKRVSVKARLLASLGSALLASWLLGATIDKLDIWGLDALLTWAPLALVVTAVAVAGGVNAINIIDGFNGLAGSTVTIMLAALGILAWNVGDELVAQLAVVGLGATAGFLFMNYPSGRLFLGDGGAYFLGFWVAEIVVLLLVRDTSISAWQVLAICAYPVIEVLFSIYRRQYLRQGDPVAPDGLHLHTLVFRRVVSRFIADTDHPWKRNAAVACVIVPWVALGASLSLVFGDTTPSAMLIVFGQVLAYIAIYRRVVRGRWTARQNTDVLSSDEVHANDCTGRVALSPAIRHDGHPL